MRKIDWDYFEKFRAYLQRIGLKPRTQYRYIYYLSKFEKAELESLAAKEDVLELNRSLDTKEIGRFSFSKNSYWVCAALKKWLKFTGYPELSLLLEQEGLKKKREEQTQYNDETIEQ